MRYINQADRYSVCADRCTNITEHKRRPCIVSVNKGESEVHYWNFPKGEPLKDFFFFEVCLFIGSLDVCVCVL